MTPELEDADAEQRDWTEFFEQFQVDEGLEPHHNVEIKELFAQPEYQESGELIFYYHNFGSFSMRYSTELYDNGKLVQGQLEVNPSLLTYIAESDYIEMAPLLEEDQEDQESEISYDNYLEPVDEIDPENGAVKKINVPKEYNKGSVDGTIKTGVRIIRKFLGAMTRVPEDFNLSRNT